MALPIAILSVALLPPAAYVYAWLTLLSPIANVIIMLIFSVVIGRVVEVVAALGKIRNTRWIGRAGCWLALAAWYFQWAAWTTLAFYDNAAHPLSAPVLKHFVDMITHPPSIIGAAIEVSAIRVIEIGDWKISGALLLAVWLVQFGMHFLVPPAMGMNRAGRPFCEVSNNWAKKSRARFAFRLFVRVPRLRRCSKCTLSNFW